MGADLSNGELREGTLTCAWHGWRFEIAGGKGLTKPWARLKTHLLLREGEDLVLEIREPSAGSGETEGQPPPGGESD
jgi:nitrite reductase/ring-hydroxylating ferredoxin subunit